MADDELLLHPHGQIGFGNGNLKTATLGEYTFGNSAALRHSLAVSPSGITFGAREVSGSIEFDVSEKGIERDVVKDVEQGKKRNFRFKDAVDTYEIVGALSEVNWKTSRGDGVTVKVSFVGKMIPRS